MAMAVELASCRTLCAPWDATSTKLKTAAGIRGATMTTTRKAAMCRPVRAAAGEEVGTESKSKPDVEKSAAPFKPPTQQKKWTGYVEKDTAGQTNIYAVEPTVYVSESVFSSGEAGPSSNEGSSIIAQIAGGFSVLAIAGAATVLLTVGQSAPTTPEKAVGYSGPPLSYYISRFSAPAPAPSGVTAVAESPELANVEATD